MSNCTTNNKRQWLTPYVDSPLCSTITVHVSTTHPKNTAAITSTQQYSSPLNETHLYNVPCWAYQRWVRQNLAPSNCQYIFRINHKCNIKHDLKNLLLSLYKEYSDTNTKCRHHWLQIHKRASCTITNYLVKFQTKIHNLNQHHSECLIRGNKKSLNILDKPTLNIIKSCVIHDARLKTPG